MNATLAPATLLSLVPPADLPPSPPRERTRAGRVVSVSGSHVIVLLAQDVAVLATAQIGGLVASRVPGATVYGVIEGLSTPLPLPSGEEQELRVAEIGLLGEMPDAAPRAFRRGVSRLPALDAPVHFACASEAACVFDLPGRASVCLGTLHQDPAIPALVDADRLLAGHFAILGAPGTGKSCALSLLLDRLAERSPATRILLLDPRGEHGRASGPRAESIGAGLRLPHWLLSFDELARVVLGPAAGPADEEAACLRELVLAARLAHAGRDADPARIGADTLLPYTIDTLARLAAAGTDPAHARACQRIAARLAALRGDRRHALLFAPDDGAGDPLAELLARLFRIPLHGRPIAVLDLSALPPEVHDVVVAVVCRLALDVAAWGGQRTPLLLVCEEAHRFAPRDTAHAAGSAGRALARIAAEGRAHGLGLGVVSPSPFGLDPALLSRCGTAFAFRTVGERDQEVVQASLPEAAPAMASTLPLLGEAEAIGVGAAMPVPMRLRFATLPEDARPCVTSVVREEAGIEGVLRDSRGGA